MTKRQVNAFSDAIINALIRFQKQASLSCTFSSQVLKRKMLKLSLSFVLTMATNSSSLLATFEKRLKRILGNGKTRAALKNTLAKIGYSASSLTFDQSTRTNRPRRSPGSSLLGIKTLLDGSKEIAGNMFNVSPKNKALRIVQFHVTSQKKGARAQVEIYTKKNSYSGFETKRESWTLIHKQWVTGKGSGKTLKLKRLECPIVLKRGKTQAFYIHATSRFYPFFSSTLMKSRKQTTVENKDVKILRGTGLSSKFKDVYRNFLWNGAIDYSLNVSRINCSRKTQKDQPRTNNAKKRVNKMSKVERRKKMSRKKRGMKTSRKKRRMKTSRKKRGMKTNRKRRRMKTNRVKRAMMTNSEK